MSSNSDTNKKAKTNEEAEFDTVQQYLLDCSLVPKNCRAIQAALRGIDEERKRMERDAKLRKKFMAENTITSENKKNTTSLNGSGSAGGRASLSHKKKTDNAMMEEEEDEWQDVAETGQTMAASSAPQEEDVSDSLLGKHLAQAAIRSMAEAGIMVKDPLAAIALALHAALLQLDFVCTGVPETKKGGFAPPIRPLAKNQFVPVDWDSDSPVVVALRYRKERVGAVHMMVKQLADNPDAVMVQVQLTPADSAEPHPSNLEFSLVDHFNQDSFNAALAASAAADNGKVLPALHYKGLAVLMTKFCNVFDLGHVNDVGETKSSSAPKSSVPSTQTTFRPATSGLSDNKYDPLRVYNQHEDPNISQFQVPRHGGDFAGDLVPGGLVDPTFGPHIGQPGNLMGPNHPAFGGGFAPGGGLGMKPRYDPVGPPGGPTDPNRNDLVDPNHPLSKRNRNKPRPPPGGTGEPNPDHERPPSEFDNMYS